jgi:hypothetical protein
MTSTPTKPASTAPQRRMPTASRRKTAEIAVTISGKVAISEWISASDRKRIATMKVPISARMRSERAICSQGLPLARHCRSGFLRMEKRSAKAA